MKNHWQAILIGILIIVASALSFELSASDAKYNALSNRHTRILQTVQTQTSLIVELRQRAILRNFRDYDELKSWVDTWIVERKPTVASILNHTFVFGGNDELYSVYYDCDDISEAMQRDALRDGYLMSVLLVGINSYVPNHLACLAEAGNGYWLVEPQSGTITFVARRD